MTPNVVKPKREKEGGGGGKRDVAKIPVWKRVIVCELLRHEKIDNTCT